VTPGRRVVFLDRDGVLTVPDERDGKGYAVRTLDALRFYPDAASSVARLRAAGFDVVVVTNQPDVANGLIDAATLDAINARVAEVTGVTRIRTCPHSRADDCPCRKPRAGLLMDEADAAPVDFAASWMVGDRDSDMGAGRAVGVRTVFIDRGWTGETGEAAHAMVATLGQAVDTILSP
jgi:D-glycero-D-manno-heptose 1,7-bisphosphate phosphatase